VADRIASDHESMTTFRAPLETVGRTDRVKVVLPPELDVVVDDVLELILDGTSYFARVESTLEADCVLRRATDNRRQAREADGENRLAAWVDDADVRVGGTVHLDVVTPGHAYGLRTPGTRVVYEATDPPADSLADIAADLDGE